MATIGYARVSTRDQNPDGQTDALDAAGCDKIFVEHASGTLAKRPALTDALGYLREGDSLVVTKLDRLGRSVRNLKQVADELQQRGVGLKALSQGIDTTTPGGRLFFHMLAAIAEFEHDPDAVEGHERHGQIGGDERQGRALASKRVIGPAPDWPARSRDQVSSTPQASGVTRPSPVITTRLMTALLPKSRPSGLLSDPTRAGKHVQDV